MNHPSSLDYRHLQVSGTTMCSIASGKGGVGKTVTAVHLAAGMARRGLKVLLIDGDIGLANVDIVLGLKPKYNVTDVIYRGIDFLDVLLEGPGGFKLAPASSGMRGIYEMSDAEREHLARIISEAAQSFDMVLIDNGAGINQSVINFCEISHMQIVVTTPEPHAIADAYALMKVLKEQTQTNRFYLIVNMAVSAAEGSKTFERLRKVAKSFLDADVDYLGSVPMDQRIQDTILARNLAGSESKHTISGQSYHGVCSEIMDRKRSGMQTPGKILWSNMLRVPQL